MADVRLDICTLDCRTTADLARSIRQGRVNERRLPREFSAVPGPVPVTGRQDFLLAEVLSDSITAPPAGSNCDRTPGVGNVRVLQNANPLPSGVDGCWQLQGDSRAPLEVHAFCCPLFQGDLVWIHRDFITGQWVAVNMCDLSLLVGILDADLEKPPDNCVAGPVDLKLEILNLQTNCWEPLMVEGQQVTQEVYSACCGIPEGFRVKAEQLGRSCRYLAEELCPLDAGVGRLLETAPAGSPPPSPTFGGPADVQVVQVDETTGATTDCLLPDGVTPLVIQVWNQCDEIELESPAQYIQFKRGKCTYLIDVECCPPEGPPTGPLATPISRLGPTGGPWGRRVSPY